MISTNRPGVLSREDALIAFIARAPSGGRHDRHQFNASIKPLNHVARTRVMAAADAERSLPTFPRGALNVQQQRGNDPPGRGYLIFFPWRATCRLWRWSMMGALLPRLVRMYVIYRRRWCVVAADVRFSLYKGRPGRPGVFVGTCIPSSFIFFRTGALFLYIFLVHEAYIYGQFFVHGCCSSMQASST